MEKDRFDILIEESLKEEVRDIKMSEMLKDRIRENTVKKEKSLYYKFKKIMDTIIEIPVPSAVAVCVLIAFFTFSTFRVTESMKKDKSILGYTSVKIIKIGGADVYVDNDGNEVSKSEKNKN